MTIHVNIGEAKTRLSELISAAIRGEDIVLSKAGQPQVRLVAVADARDGERERVLAQRQAALGKWSHGIGDHDLGIGALKADRDPGLRERKGRDGSA